MQLWSNSFCEDENFAATFISMFFLRERNNKAVLSTIPGTIEYSQRDPTSDQKDFEECYFCFCFAFWMKMLEEVFDEMEEDFWWGMSKGL